MGGIFKLKSKFRPTGDHPEAIKRLEPPSRKRYGGPGALLEYAVMHNDEAERLRGLSRPGLAPFPHRAACRSLEEPLEERLRTIAAQRWHRTDPLPRIREETAGQIDADALDFRNDGGSGGLPEQ